MKVSFVLPIYNGAATLEGCLDHLCAQRFRDWECLVVNDASPDNSLAIVEARARRDRRLRVLQHEHNLGVGQARNTGMRAACGDYLHFLDQDDHLSRDGMGQLLRCMDRNAEAAGVYGDFDIVHVGSGRRFPYQPPRPTLDFKSFARSNPVVPLAVLHRRSAVEKVGGFGEGYDHADDWDLWGRITRSGKVFVHCDTWVGEYRLHGSNNSCRLSPVLQKVLHAIRALHGPDPRVSDPAPQWAAGCSLEEQRLAIARQTWSHVGKALLNGDMDQAVELVALVVNEVGREPIGLDTIATFHEAIGIPCQFAGLDPNGYYVELEGRLESFFARVEALLGEPGFAAAALRKIRQVYVSDLVSQNLHLKVQVHNYQTSRSYRIGRVITRLLRLGTRGR